MTDVARDPTALHLHLAPGEVPVAPRVTPSGRHCQLAPGPRGRVFSDPWVSGFVAELFGEIERHTGTGDLPKVGLSPHDLFHCHMFVGHHTHADLGGAPQPLEGAAAGVFQPPAATADARATAHIHGSKRASSVLAEAGLLLTSPRNCPPLLPLPPRAPVGLLFHAKEYPVYHEGAFPYRLGACQEDSGLVVSERCLDMRNLLWLEGRLFALDVGATSPLQHLLWRETAPLRTLYEEDLGTPLADITCIPGAEEPPGEGVGRQAGRPPQGGGALLLYVHPSAAAGPGPATAA